MRAEKAHYPVTVLCRCLQVSKSGFYAWCGRPMSSKAHRDVTLTSLVRASHAGGRKTYGSPRIHRELRLGGERVSRKRVARLMRQEGLYGLRKRRFRKTTDSAHRLPVAKNLLDRQFAPELPNQAWVADITYLWTSEGWLYLAVVIDLFSRRVVGWAIDDNMRTPLVLSALRMAVQQRRPLVGLLHHSDRGSQYASHEFQKYLSSCGIVCSMSRKAECWDNAVVESFFGTLKQELLYRQSWKTREVTRVAVAEYIMCFFNLKRLHSTLGYLSPVMYESTAASVIAA